MVVSILLAPPEYSKSSNPNDEPNSKDTYVAKYPGNENQGTQGQPLMTTVVLCSI